MFIFVSNITIMTLIPDFIKCFSGYMRIYLSCSSCHFNLSLVILCAFTLTPASYRVYWVNLGYLEALVFLDQRYRFYLKLHSE